jgi:L-fuconate dehydratase
VPKIVGFETHDVRFPTSRTLDGSDAMNPNPDYAAAYLVIRADDGSAGHGYAFTIGPSNRLQTAAVSDLESFVLGVEVDELIGDLGAISRRLVGESHLRWLGPEKGVAHMAIGAVMNALFDLASRRAGLPLWRWLAERSPTELVDMVDFRYLSDALTRDEALDLLTAGTEGKEQRMAELQTNGYPAYTTTPGWLGYSDERMVALCQEAVADGFRQVKMKVGRSVDDDRRRCALARATIGDQIAMAVDANQVWDVPQAVAWIRALAEFNLAWVEEPTSPDEILGLARIRQAVAPVPIATGEHVANRVMVKQLLQAQAVDVLQIDACRVAGVPENLANLLLAAKFGVRVCPHAGGVGLCEAVQHLSFFDYAALSGSLEGRMIEWIDHLHEHFTAPARVAGGRYLAPSAPGASTEMRAESIADHTFPGGRVWSSASGQGGSGQWAEAQWQ